MYERHLRIRFDTVIDKYCTILGNGFIEDFGYVDQLQKHCFTRKKQLKKKDKRQDNETISKIREEWLKFIKIWIDESGLFHNHYPKSQNQSFYELRIIKLGIHIYEYLHENCIFHQILVDEHSHENSTNWMIGHWFPSLDLVDPAHPGDDEEFRTYIFPLEGM